MEKKSIKALGLNDLENLILEQKQPKFRASQILEWLYKCDVNSFESMTNLPKSLISWLTSNFVITIPSIVSINKSTDGSIKYILSLPDNSLNSKFTYIETVAIPQKYNNYTLCISSQAGCPMGCKFCATGKQGFVRNLTMGEIIDQVIVVQNNLGKQINNIVVMGQGEPFLNYENLIDALQIINNPKCIGIGSRKITVSTCGIINGIQKFSEINKQYGLAVSLHSAIQTTHNIIMPNAKNHSLKKLKNALKFYQNKTNRRITFEYIMLKNINDDIKHLNALINFSSNFNCLINLIQYNNIKNSNFKSSNYSTIKEWKFILRKSGVEATVRKSKGSSINAACGQLLNNLNN